MKFLTKTKNLVLDFLFPVRCVGCRKVKAFLCDDCLLAIPIHTEHFCPVCKKRNTPYGRTCPDCRGTLFLDGILVAAPYKHPTLSKAIHTYKYRFVRDLGIPLGTLLLHSVRRSNIPLPDFLCAVPLHPLRLRWRGFNQSELLADILSNNLLSHTETPLLRHLRRIRFTTPQARTDDASERKRNLADAFEWTAAKDTPDIRGKVVWLVDDIATTATTLDECAKALKHSGAKEVFGIVLAR